MWNKNIIGIDIDDRKEGKMILRVLRILNIKGKYRLSSSKRGYHFRLSVKNHTRKENLLIRYMLNDCYGRWRLDVRRLKSGIRELDVLFDNKNNNYSSQWRNI